jgi:RNase H-like domain found in reverse transcriptase
MPPRLGPLPPAAIAAFEELRKRLLTPPALALPRAKGHLCLDTDASDGQLGCCLLQDQPDGTPLPLGILVEDTKFSGAELLDNREGVSSQYMGQYSSTTLRRVGYFYRKDGPPCPQMGYEPFGCTRSVSALAPSPRGIYLQGGITPRNSASRSRFHVTSPASGGTLRPH